MTKKIEKLDMRKKNSLKKKIKSVTKYLETNTNAIQPITTKHAYRLSKLHKSLEPDVNIGDRGYFGRSHVN